VKLTYGNYQHDDSEAFIVFRTENQVSQRGERLIQRRIAQITGVLHGTDQDDLESNMAAMRSAYNTDGKDFLVYLNDGTTLSTDHRLINSESASGVQVLSGPTWTQGRGGAEHSTFRSYEITLAADFLTNAVLESWDEDITAVGTGGQRVVYVELATEAPDKQVVNQKTLTFATQSGSAVGVGAYPEPPAPVFASDEIQVSRTVGRRSPRKRGRIWTGYRVSWSYQFHSPVPLEGLPSIQ